MDESNISWPPPPDDFTVDERSVHVWAIQLDLSDLALNRLAKTLATEERQRAESFHFMIDRNRFTAGRAILREILGLYLRISPSSLEFEYGPQGKPTLAGHTSQEGLQFNLAHSGGFALVALTRGRPIGIDLEQTRSIEGEDEMTTLFCSPREKAQYDSLAPCQKNEAFFRIWTRKEAWLKATGDGIGTCLSQVEVSFQSDESPRCLTLPPGSEMRAHDWTLFEPEPVPGYAAAVAVPGPVELVCCWRWNEQEEFQYAYS